MQVSTDLQSRAKIHHVAVLTGNFVTFTPECFLEVFSHPRHFDLNCNRSPDAWLGFSWPFDIGLRLFLISATLRSEKNSCRVDLPTSRQPSTTCSTMIPPLRSSGVSSQVVSVLCTSCKLSLLRSQLDNFSALSHILRHYCALKKNELLLHGAMLHHDALLHRFHVS